MTNPLVKEEYPIIRQNHSLTHSHSLSRIQTARGNGDRARVVSGNALDDLFKIKVPHDRSISPSQFSLGLLKIIVSFL